jgi:protein AroM
LIGLATIGQSPRADVVRTMFDSNTSNGVLQAGALDGLDAATIAGLAPASHEHPLVSRLADGNEVVIAKERLIPLLESAIQRLEAGGSSLICVLCTGEFYLGTRSVRLVYPDRLITGVVDALLPTGHLGVIIPHLGQTGSMIEKWQREGRHVSIEVHSPYSGATSPAVTAARLDDQGCEMIVFDCMGYTREDQDAAQSVCDVPVFLASGLVGSILGSIVASDHAR